LEAGPASKKTVLPKKDPWLRKGSWRAGADRPRKGARRVSAFFFARLLGSGPSGARRRGHQNLRAAFANTQKTFPVFFSRLIAFSSNSAFAGDALLIYPFPSRAAWPGKTVLRWPGPGGPLPRVTQENHIFPPPSGTSSHFFFFRNFCPPKNFRPQQAAGDGKLSVPTAGGFQAVWGERREKGPLNRKTIQGLGLGRSR